jgi:hypothetical protein
MDDDDCRSSGSRGQQGLGLAEKCNVSPREVVDIGR